VLAAVVQVVPVGITSMSRVAIVEKIGDAEPTTGWVEHRLREGAMQMRVVRAQTGAGQVEELAKRWEAFFAPRAMPGFRRAYLAGNRERNTVVGVTVWDRRPDAATMEATEQAFQEQIRDLMAGLPTIEDYELLAAR
jgi:quinol monooxygenase YgiN